MPEETKELMENYGIDEDTANRARELMDEGINEDLAAELAEEGL